MRTSDLLIRSLRHYWRTNLAVVAGVATAVAVLGGALLVGDSVRGSLRGLVLDRIGRTDYVVASPELFTESLGRAIQGDPMFQEHFSGLTPLVVLPGMATHQESGRRAGRVTVYGVDEGFRTFHGRPAGEVGPAPGERGVWLSGALAREIGAAAGDTVLVRIQRPADIPLESLHGRKDDVGRTVRLTVEAVLPASELGDFSLQPQQGDVYAAFMSLPRLQAEIGARLDEAGGEAQVNTLLVAGRGEAAGEGAGALETLVRRHARLPDVGLFTRRLSAGGGAAAETLRALSLEAHGTLVDTRREQAIAGAARELGLTATPVLTYLVNSLRSGDRTIPYSLVTAIELTTLVPGLAADDSRPTPIVLNEWAARELAAQPGARVTLDYYVWEDPGRLSTRSSTFEVAAIVPLDGPAGDRDFAPFYPGITDTENLRDWDPPFPIDLRRIRDVDEDYWRRYRTTPKAFVPESFGRAFWGSRYGEATSIRIAPGPGVETFPAGLREAIDPIQLGIAVRDVRAEGFAASRGATNFGEYFTYFSFFLVVSALLLTALFFRLGVEQRVREIGLLRAVGFPAAAVRRLLVGEGVLLALAGSAIGTVGAVAYAQALMFGLRTWWVDAVGTTALRLHVSPLSLAAGAVGGVAAAAACIWWTLRLLSRITERSLLAGEVSGPQPPGARTARFGVLNSRLLLLSAAAAAVLLALGAAGLIAAAAAFFGAGALLLVAALGAVGAWLARDPRTTLAGGGWRAMWRLGARNASYRPARSVLSIAVMAAATFVLIAVGSFRRDGVVDWADRESGTGGYPLVVETVLPIAYDPNGADGRVQLGLAAADDVVVEPFRLRPGDDASCLNLYAPQQPRILGARRAFRLEDRFAFAATLDGAERDNPWRLLEAELEDGAVPVIGDANSMTYVLHKAIGDEIVIDAGGQPVRLRLVATLDDSIFQSELLMSEEHFLRLFPEQEGYGLLLVQAPAERVAAVSEALEQGLGDHGADAVGTADRLASFHRVENTYLSTFQALGGLGLLLGTVGLAAVLLRNVLERRRELALLGAVGYGRRRLLVIIVAESAMLLACGLAAGAVCAVIATAPAAAAHGGGLTIGAGGWLMLFAVFATGLISAVVATRAAIASRLLEALRAE